MRCLIAIAVVLAWVAGAVAQVPPQPKSFGFYRCTCESSGSTSTGSSSASMAQVLGQTSAPTSWAGSAYATSDRDAALKAQMACTSESRGNMFSCLNCKCAR